MTVTVSNGRPVDTFASASAPAGFAPAQGTAPAAAAPAEPKPAPAAPWVEAPTKDEHPDPRVAREGGPGLRLKAEGVSLTKGHCGPVPVARYGLDWRPEREWTPGAEDAPPDPWSLRKDPRLPPVPPPEPVPVPTVEEHGTPAGSWLEAR
ncbi:MAG: hypothetical protein AB7N76_30780 [Planctomycetota bacterium]